MRRNGTAGSGEARFCLAALLAAAGVSCAMDTTLGRAGGNPSPVTVVEVGYPKAAALLADAKFAPERSAAGFRLAVPAPANHGRGWRSIARGIVSQWPATSDGTIELSVPSQGASVRLHRAHASGGQAVSHGRTLVYSDASAGVDSIVLATASAIEELVVVSSDTAQVAYDVQLPHGWGMRQGNGNPNIVEFLDGTGAPRLRMKADKAWDGTGEEATLAVSIEGMRIGLHPSGAKQWPVVVDPTWTSTGDMAVPRPAGTATLLSTGKVLIAGGSVEPLTAELYDPISATFSLAGQIPLPTGRYTTITLLTSGRVFITSTNTQFNDAAAALYDPEAQAGAGAFSTAANPPAFQWDDAILLRSGRVMMFGFGAYLYDPKLDQYLATPTPPYPLMFASASLLPDGRVLFAGGQDTIGSQVVARTSAVLFDETSGGGAGAFTTTGSMSNGRWLAASFSLNSGRVLVLGGSCENDGPLGLVPEIYDPSAGSFSQASLQPSGFWSNPISVLLPPNNPLILSQSAPLVGEVFNPTANSWTSLPAPTAFSPAAATLLASGEVLVHGSLGGDGKAALVFDPTSPPNGSVAPASAISGPYDYGSATMLPSGKLVVPSAAFGSSAAEIFSEATNTIAPTGFMTVERHGHSSTLLSSGLVLITGGWTNSNWTPLSSSELFDPNADGGKGAFVAGPAMTTPRDGHGAALLASGKVLIAGGFGTMAAMVTTAELYDPTTATFTKTADLPNNGFGQTRIVRLTDGTALVVGGSQMAAVFDPAVNGGVGAFRSAVSTNYDHSTFYSLSLLPDGTALVVGGANKAEVFIASTNGGAGSFMETGSPAIATWGSAAAALPSGKLVAFGLTADDMRADMYDPVSRVFEAAGSSEKESTNAAFLLSSGRVLELGSFDPTPPYSYLWTSSFDPSDPLRPVLSQVPGVVIAATPIGISGWGFRPTIGGGKKAAANHPVALWMPYQGGGPVLSFLADWTDTAATWTPPVTALHGHGLLFVAVNGIVSKGVPVKVLPAVNGTRCTGWGQCASLHCVDGFCCDTGCAGACVACSAAKKGSGADGVCAAVGLGKDPDNECSADPPETCKQAGACDGTGKCGMHPAGTVCVPSFCSGDVYSPDYKCDGAGACKGSGLVICSPYVCTEAGTKPACSTSCTAQVDCAAGATCTAGACVVPIVNGKPCLYATECQSGYCVDNVCCNAPCAELCMACSVAAGAAKDGSCAAVKADTDPGDECAEEPQNPCGQTGLCNGYGECARPAMGEFCGDAQCVDDSFGNHSIQSGVACDGFGTCKTSKWNNDCGLYRCGGTVCKTGCSADSDCIKTAWCNPAGICESKKNNGEDCSLGSQCASELCADGTCCDTRCDGQCEACDRDIVQGKKTGKCSAVSGPPPTGRKACDNAAPECVGTCDGVTTAKCTYPVETTPCGSGTCKDGEEYRAGCDGKGACGTPVPSSCVKFACGATACKTTCSADTDCASEYKCDTATSDCVPAGAKCDGDHALKNNGVVVKDCAPFKCSSGDVCLNLCTSRADCVEGMACTVDGKCEPSAADVVDDSGGGCGCRASGRAAQAPFGLLFAAFIVGARRRRRYA
jgi:hypothetical protein